MNFGGKTHDFCGSCLPVRAACEERQWGGGEREHTMAFVLS